jgi:hypothetical protein
VYHGAVRALVLAGLAVAGCGGDGAALRLAPIGTGPCGRPTDARALLVTPLGDFAAERRSIELGRAVALAELPADTRAFAVEVIGASGEVAAVGRTAPLELDDFADGDTIGVAMAPPDGVCPAGALTAARDRLQVARVGDGVLVVGGAATASAERYDPATETTAEVPLPAAFTGAIGVVGASLIGLPDGRAVLIGGTRPGYTIYTPGQGFGPATLITETRAHHVGLALDTERVLLAGGCGVVDAVGACEGDNVRRDTRIVTLATGVITAGPPLAIARRDGVGAIERAPDGRRYALLVGGTDDRDQPVTAGERLDLDGGPPLALPGVGAALAALDSGGHLAAFAPAGAAPAAVAAVIVPDGAAPRPTAPPLARTAPVVVTQDDGAVLALGGGTPLRYRPSQHDWQRLADLDAAIGGAPAALRWDDGSILVFGGRGPDGQPTAAVWRFRPRLLGPLAGAITVVPADSGSDPPLAPLDPAAVDRTGGWRLGGAAPSWAIVGGPTAGLARLDATVTVPPAGLAILTGFVDPAERDELVVVPGQPLVWNQHRGGQVSTVCRGPVAPPAGPTTITVELTASSARAALGGAAVLSCPLDERPRGRLGIAARGEPIAIGSIAIAR